MGRKTKIGWCDSTWSPVVGCSKISEGCQNCWAESVASRFAGAFHGVRWDGTILPTSTTTAPTRWRTPRHIFAMAMTDFCHERMPEADLASAGMVMEHTHRHTYTLLTKRPEGLVRAVKIMFGANRAPRHVQIGVSVESQKYVHRIESLLVSGVTDTPIVCCEPLLDPAFLDPWIDRVAWVIAGCESGARRAGCAPDWIRDIRDTCVEHGVPFFLKQMELNGRVVRDHKLDGKVWDQTPGGER